MCKIKLTVIIVVNTKQDDVNKRKSNVYGLFKYVFVVAE